MTQKFSKDQEIDMLKSELLGLFDHIQKIRKEIASIRNPDDHFSSMTDQLDAIIDNTELATNDIMENVEQIEEISEAMRENVKDEKVSESVDEIMDRTANIIVSCSFQDITGQRISKVVKSLKYIEERITALVTMWGESAILKVKVSDDEETDEYKKFLHGPSLEGQGVTQSEVDSMLNGGAAPEGKSFADLKKKKPESEAEAKPAEPAPAAKAPAKAEEEDDSGKPALDQNDIDALFD